ncbi:MAG TPA: DNA repair protein RecO [Polyangiales bacterium]|nr:DNA repair protein RecO [Polyangiales bacterium]
MRARAQRDDALLLRSVDYGDADRILTLLTPQHGKFSVLAKAARKSKRRFAGSLEPFALLTVEFATAKSGLARLESAVTRRAFPKLLGDLARMNAAGAAFRLLRDLMPEDAPDPGVFADAVQLLEALDAGELPARALSVCFELTQLARAGWSPGLEACGVCGKPARGHPGDFDARRGYLVCQACGGAAYRLRASVRHAWEQACQGDFREAAAAEWTSDDLDVSERAVAAFIEHRLHTA